MINGSPPFNAKTDAEATKVAQTISDVLDKNVLLTRLNGAANGMSTYRAWWNNGGQQGAVVDSYVCANANIKGQAVTDCPICNICLPEDIIDQHIRTMHKPYREPWWLRALRWMVK